jgi:CO/xanthine dehydrogenase Mo-binding subunit
VPFDEQLRDQADAGRIDARAKATGRARYVADISLPDMAHVAIARSAEPHALITGVDVSAAESSPGVIGVFTADDVSAGLYGRSIVDTPLLAREKVRFVGERVVAVVAQTRQQAEAAAALVEIEYEPLPAVVTGPAALDPDAPAVHEAPWSYAGAVVGKGQGANVIHHGTHGSADEVAAALATAAFTVDSRFHAHSVHQGYLEPQACIAHYESADSVKLWLTAKAPYGIRRIVANCLDLDPAAIELNPITLGGDFGGKGSPQEAPLCVELSRLTGRPVKSVLRYSEDLTATNPRHPCDFRVRLGCDAEGILLAASIECVMNAGAYGSFSPHGSGAHGVAEILSYRIPAFHSDVTRVYTNTVPRGNVRAPGAPQGVFAFESALDELAAAAGLDPAELRRKNLLHTGESDAHGDTWIEHRGEETLAAALDAFEQVEPPEGWLYGRGIGIYSRPTPNSVNTSLRLTTLADGGVRVETPLTETGTGSHTALRRMLADRMGIAPGMIEIVGVSTRELPNDAGAGGSRVTAGFALAADAAAKAWQDRTDDEPVTVVVEETVGAKVGSYTVQIAQVAVDPATGQVKVLEILTAVDVAAVVSPTPFRMQIDGGTAMGFGYACLEDLDESDGQIWAANMGDFKIPTARDVPRYKTVLVPGGIGVGAANVKNIGESSTPPTAAAIANAVFDATGCRPHELPITAERVYTALRAKEGSR